MASAGRILIMPKGEWNAETEYEMLDLVNRNGKSWLAKKTSVGVEPSDANAEHWMDMFDITAESIKALSADKGGVVKGDIVIEKQWPTLSLVDESGRKVLIEKSSKSDVISLYNYLDADNYNNIMIMPETSNVKDCFYLRNVVDGTAKEFKIFGEHNLDLLNQYIDARIAEKMK